MKTVNSILLDNGINTDKQSEGARKVKCPKCQPPHNSKDFPLSLTITAHNVMWNCHHCAWSGGEFLTGMSKTYQTKIYEKPKKPERVVRNEFLYSFMKNRGLTKSTIDELKIYVDNGSWIAFPYFDENSELINIKFRDKNKNFRQTANAKRIIYNYDNVYQSKEVIFVEGELDVLSLYEVGFKNVTSLPDGAGKEAKFNKDDARFKCLDNCPLQATKIIIFTDNDQAGRALHQELLHRFGKDKCWYVKTTEGCKDANEVLMKHGPMKLRELLESAIPYPVDGLYTAYDYYNQIQDLYEGNYVKPLEIGMGPLDEIYKILPSTFHCITGVPNHGKSVFLDQVLLNLAERHNWKFAIFSPEHSTSMHIRRMLQMYKKKGFDDIAGPKMTKEELNDGLDFINKHFFFIETKDAVPNISYILDICASAVNKFGINGIVIDPYNEVSAKRQGNAREDEHIRDFISECKRFLRLYEATMWVVAHPTKLPKNNDGSYMAPSAYDISGSSHWSNMADCILTVHRDFDDNTTKVITRKIREQDLYGKIGEVRFVYNNETKSFEEPKNDYWDDIPKGVGPVNIIELEIDEIKPYKDNPRVNKDAITVVKNSLSKFGWQQPLVLDKNNEIVVGHTRYYAAIELGMKKIPCLIADDLNDEKIKAYRIMDNKSSEYASWNYGLLTKEMQDILESGGLDLTFTGFSNNEIDNMIDDINVELEDESSVARMDELNLITCPDCGHKFSEFSAK